MVDADKINEMYKNIGENQINRTIGMQLTAGQKAQQENKKLKKRIELLEEKLEQSQETRPHETIVMWRSVDEVEPPKDGRKILGARYNATFEVWDIAVIEWNGETWKVVPTRDYRISLLPSHWKPITEPKDT